MMRIHYSTSVGSNGGHPIFPDPFDQFGDPTDIGLPESGFAPARSTAGETGIASPHATAATAPTGYTTATLAQVSICREGAGNASLIAPCVREVVARIGLDPLGARTSRSGSIWTGVKDRIVARLLPPESSSVEQVSREVGVSAATLERWRAERVGQWIWRSSWRQSALDERQRGCRR